MSIDVLLRNHPHRSIALRTTSHALVLRHSSSSAEASHASHAQGFRSAGDVARCIVDFSTVDDIDLSDYWSLSPLPVQGTLGLITVDHGIFLCVVSSSTHVATVRPGETVQRIDAVEFRSCPHSSIRSSEIDLDLAKT